MARVLAYNKALGLIPSTAQNCMEGIPIIPEELEARGWDFQDHPSDSEASGETEVGVIAPPYNVNAWEAGVGELGV